MPSILSGRWPAEHRNWSYFVYDPANSPFRRLRVLGWLPQALTSRRIFRRWLSKFLKAQMGFRGYFDLYNIPFRHIGLFDFTEKKSPLCPGGMNRGDNIFDLLVRRGISYHVSNPAHSEGENLAALKAAVAKREIDFAFLYWPGLDGLLHQVGNQSPEIPKKLRDYELNLRDLIGAAETHYEQVALYVFSDHGMANCDERIDLRARIDPLPWRMGRDYVVVYDSTMARFWFFNENARRDIEQELGKVQQGRIVSDSELKDLGAFFPDRYFGELVFLVREGVLIVPSHMGERPIRAMHGYHPDEPQSYAAICATRELPSELTDIPHIHNLMASEAQRAHGLNRATQKLVPAV